jgi:hypothetical protein
MRQQSRLWAVALIVFGVGFGLYAFRPAASTAQPAVGAGGAGGPKYTVVDTEGTNLLVTDNSTNTMYYYTVDPDKTVGDELKLRGSIDLNEVGKPVMKPKHHKSEK